MFVFLPRLLELIVGGRDVTFVLLSHIWPTLLATVGLTAATGIMVLAARIRALLRQQRLQTPATGAAGSAGFLAGQIAWFLGTRVIGTAGPATRSGPSRSPATSQTIITMTTPTLTISRQAAAYSSGPTPTWGRDTRRRWRRARCR
ncbi:hypothetical protein ACWDOR_44475 [Streptosporangium canum]